MGGDNLPSPVGIELTDLPNIGGASGPPGPPGSGTTVQDYERMNVADALISKIFYWDFLLFFGCF